MENRHMSRLISLIVLFVFVCLLYTARLINVQIAGQDFYTFVSDDTYTRKVTIQAQRGEVYDCNGKPLIKNEYSYSIVLDRGTLPTRNAAQNEMLLELYDKILRSDAEYTLSKITFPATGKYPDYEIDEDFFNTTESRARFSRLISSLGIGDIGTIVGGDELPYALSIYESMLSGYTLGRDLYALELAEQRAVTLGDIIDKLAVRYGIVDSDGELLYERDTADFLLRLRYDMESRDFSFLTPYTVATDADISLLSYLGEGAQRGYTVRVEAKRVYCEPGVASHILGMTGKIGAGDVEYYTSQGYRLDATVGVSGVELAFEEELHGMDGEMTITEDEYGNIIGREVTKEPKAGYDIYLTLDVDLQRAAEKALEDNVEYIHGQSELDDAENDGEDACAGALAAVDVETGKVRALATYPTYDLTTYREDLPMLNQDKNTPLLNRALNGKYPPGSTFKPAVAAAAMTEGIIDENTIIETKGIYTYYAGFTPRCWLYVQNGWSHGKINVSTAIEVSCNYFFYELGRRLTIETMNRYCRAFGLGEKTGIELPESEGVLAGPDYRTQHGLGGWNPGDTLVAAIGQSDNLFTPLQLSVYMSALINDGERYRAHILDSVREYGTGNVVREVERETLSSVALDDHDVNVILNAMQRVIETGTQATLFDKLPIKVGGKTGTAQVGSGSSNAVFVGFAPFDDPEIVVTSVIEHGSAGAWAAVSVRDVFLEYFDIELDEGAEE